MEQTQCALALPVPLYHPQGYIIPMGNLTMQNSCIQLNHIVSGGDLNGYGLMHGGKLLTLCDETGYLSARRHSHLDCLTRAVHRARFHQPAHKDEQLIISAMVGLTGRSSIWVPVEVRSNSNQELVMDAVFVFTAVNEDQLAIKVPTIQAECKELQRFQALMKAMRAQLLA
jgi:acyl-CoA hydrolase